MRSVLRLLFLLIITLNGARSLAQLDAVELAPGMMVPIANEADHYRPGWAINFNYYYDDSPGYSLYGGAGIHQMTVNASESIYASFFGLNTYYGGQFKIALKENLFDIAVGGEIGYMIRFYTSNWFSGSPSIFIESSLGVSPKLAFHWRINEGWSTLGAFVKYNAYFSLNSNFYTSSFADGVHQWMLPGISWKINL